MNEKATPSPSASSADDARFMQLALALGRRGLGNTWPNPAVGAVIVKDGAILARGWTQAGGRPHAEIEALRRARVVTACELLTACQAARLASGRWADGRWAGGCGRLLAELSGLIEPIEADRPLGADIERLAAGSWLRPTAAG